MIIWTPPEVSGLEDIISARPRSAVYWRAPRKLVHIDIWSVPSADRKAYASSAYIEREVLMANPSQEGRATTPVFLAGSCLTAISGVAALLSFATTSHWPTHVSALMAFVGLMIMANAVEQHRRAG